MSSIIKNFNSFRSVNEDESLVSRTLSALGNSAKDALKGKVVSALLTRMGIPKGPQGQPTIGETIITKLVEQVGISEYPKFISGDIKVRDLAPKLAKATIETLTKLGVDGIATRIFRIDPSNTNTFLYRTIENLIENASARENFQEQIENMWTLVLGGTTEGGPGKDPGMAAILGSSNRGQRSSMDSSKNSPFASGASDNLVADIMNIQDLGFGRGTTMS